MKSACVIIALLLPLVAATAPAERFNVNGQHRTRTCAAMKGDRIPLRFADGTPTGFYAFASDPSKQGGDKPCPAGCLELDAQEILTTASGVRLVFHPGGGPDHYEDHVEHGQYGHVAIDDLKAPPKLLPVSLNGKPAPFRGGQAFLITPTRIPRDMWYKPNVNESGRSGSTYHTYGNPGFDKTDGRGDWTYINWSWVQNGGAEYPANICRGGGMVRALGRRGMTFTAADVVPVVGYSYGTDNQVNGRVTAFYGRTTAGPGERGSEVFGWLPLAYQKIGNAIIPLTRRSPAKPTTYGASSSDKDRTVRMAMNLLSELKPDSARRGELLKQIATEPDAFTRMELLTKLSRMDDADTLAAMLRLVRDDKDASVREQAISLIGFMRSPSQDLQRTTTELKSHLARVTDEREKSRTSEALEKLATSPAAAPATQPRRD